MRDGEFQDIKNVHTVVHAAYGCPGSFGTTQQPLGDNAVDITNIVNQELLDDDAVIRLEGKNLVEAYGIDPWNNQKKTLKVDDSGLHLLDNKELEFTNQEWTEQVQCSTSR